MRQFPLLDLKSAFADAQQCLAELHELASTLYAETESTWTDLHTIAGQAEAALHALGTLPLAVLEGMAKDEVDLQEMEDRADAVSY